MKPDEARRSRLWTWGPAASHPRSASQDVPTHVARAIVLMTSDQRTTGGPRTEYDAVAAAMRNGATARASIVKALSDGTMTLVGRMAGCSRADFQRCANWLRVPSRPALGSAGAASGVSASPLMAAREKAGNHTPATRASHCGAPEATATITRRFARLVTQRTTPSG